MNTTERLAVGLVMILASACGGDDGASAPIDASIDGAPTVLEGRWLAPCLSQGGPPGTMSTQWSVTYDGNGYRAEQRYSMSTGCASERLRLTEAGTFTIGGAATVPAGATNIDYLQGSMVVRTFAGYAAVINGSGICTGVTFVDDTDVSLSGATCAGSPAPTNGSTLLGLFELAGNDLRLGEVDGLGQLGDAVRPTLLRTNGYTRQP